MFGMRVRVYWDWEEVLGVFEVGESFKGKFEFIRWSKMSWLEFVAGGLGWNILY